MASFTRVLEQKVPEPPIVPSKPGKYVLEEVVILIQLETFCTKK